MIRRFNVSALVLLTSVALVGAACGSSSETETQPPDDADGGADVVGGSDSVGGSGAEGGMGGAGGEAGGEPAWQIEVPQAGGAVRDVDVAGDVAYAATGPRLVLWDLSDPATPVELGQTSPFAGAAKAVAVKGSTAYVAEANEGSSQIQVVNVADPSAPIVLGAFDYSTSPFRRPAALAISGDTLYIADGDVGLVALDITHPTSPVVVGGEPSLAGASHVQVVGDRIYVAMSGFIGAAMAVLDTSDLSVIGITGIPNGIDFEFMSGGRMVIVGAFGAFVLDVQDPMAPAQLFHEPMLGAQSVSSNGDRVMIPAEDGLHVLDMSGPDIVHSGPTDVPVARTTADTSVGAHQLMMTDYSRVLLIDPETSTLTGSAWRSGCVDCTSIATMGDKMLLGDFYAGATLVNASDLSPVGRFELPGPQNGVEAVAVASNELAVVADWSTGVYTVDISDPTQPVQLAHLATDGFPSAVVVQDTWAFVGESTGAGAVRAIDISSPSAPVEIAMVPTSKVRALASDGTMIYVADEANFNPGGLRILDATTPSQLSQVAHYTACESALGVDVRDGVAVVACTNGFHFVDVTDPTQPQQLAVYGAGGWAAVMHGQRAYLGHGTGVDVVDISATSQPMLLERWPTSAGVRAITVSGESSVAVATGLGGVYHFQLTE